ncbi:hypothetical protein AB0M95_40355 [Sphaerisporangium sp. NPDC051017]|uniref:hypothetical protein n=1 Tax=Sphaerisporangium sp. NPDC051017 TaxID=3154636 RepID=UPI00342AEC29
MTEIRDPNFADIFGDHPDLAVEQAPIAAFDMEGVFDDAPNDAGGTVVDSGARPPRFPGDTSELPAEVCWALQELVAAPHITEKSKKHWPVVLQYENMLRSRLAELGEVPQRFRTYRPIGW